MPKRRARDSNPRGRERGSFAQQQKIPSSQNSLDDSRISARPATMFRAGSGSEGPRLPVLTFNYLCTDDSKAGTPT